MSQSLHSTHDHNSHVDNNNRLSTSSSLESELIREHNKHVVKPPNFSSKSIKHYLATRYSTLFVPKLELAQYSWSDIYNPFKVLGELSWKNWGYFTLAFWIWTFDALDYFSVSLNLHAIAESLDRSVSDLSWSITLVLMLRSVGALIFGALGDRYGRRWPLIINLAVLSVLQIGTGFVKNYQAFLGVRALFGCFMGGIFGNAAAFALDDCPAKARGTISGIFQQGYAFGYLLAVVFTRAIVDNSPKGWRAIFWFSSGPPVIMIAFLYYLNETDVAQQNIARLKFKQQQDLDNGITHSKRDFFKLGANAKDAFRRYWLIMIYLVLAMAGFNFMSHGSQDLYPTMLTVQLGYGSDRATVNNSVANLGAMFGGFICGHLSTFCGRRLTAIAACVIGGAMIYPWAFIRNTGNIAGAFFLQSGVQGAWGVVPIFLMENSPPLYRSIVSGLSYQLGNLASSASSTIESTIGERFPIKTDDGEDAYDYAKVMSIFMGCVFGYLILMMFFGFENRGAAMSAARDDEFENLHEIDDDKNSLNDSLENIDIENIDHDKPNTHHID